MFNDFFIVIYVLGVCVWGGGVLEFEEVSFISMNIL